MHTLNWYKARWAVIQAAMRELDGLVADNIDAAIADGNAQRTRLLWMFVPPWLA